MITGFIYTMLQLQIKQVAKDLFQTQISNLVKTIVSGVLDGLNKQLENLSQRNNELKKENTDIKKNTASFRNARKLLSAVDAAEQYSRWNCLRISCMEETDRENTDNIVLDIAEAINVNMDLRDR